MQCNATHQHRNAYLLTCSPRAQVEELAPLGVKNPVRSPLLWGTYELLYSSEPGAIGGPLAKGPVKSVKQKLVEPNGLVDEV